MARAGFCPSIVFNNNNNEQKCLINLPSSAALHANLLRHHSRYLSQDLTRHQTLTFEVWR